MSPIFLFLYNIKKLKNSNFCVPINKNVPLNIPDVKTCAESSSFGNLAHVFTFWLEKQLGWFKSARREDYDSLRKYSSYFFFRSDHFSYLRQIGCLFHENYPFLDKSNRRIQPGIAQADLFRALRAIHQKIPGTTLQYEWGKSNQDTHMP